MSSLVTPYESEFKTETPIPSRPGAEFGKVEVGEDIMGNLFGDNQAEEKSKKEKTKKEKNKKEPKEGGLFGGIFGGKKTNKSENETPDLSELMGKKNISKHQSDYVKTTVIPQVQNQPLVSSYVEEDCTEIFDEDEINTNDNVVKLMLEDSAGFQLPSFIEINMSKGYATVGRLDKAGRRHCDYNFDASMSFISRIHLRLEKVNDQIQVIDLNSSNGTFINGTQIVANIPYPISKGDLLMFSKKRITYKML